MKHYCNLKNWVAVGLLALATGTVSAQCVDMSTLDDGNKRFINQDMGCTEVNTVTTSTTIRHDSVYGWLDPKLAPTTHPRQTLMTSEGTDDLCPELSVLPPGLSTSARLMNDGYQEGDSAKGEWLGFVINVDAANPILLINYAAVIEDPQHTSVVNTYPNYGQPFCGFYVMDSEGKTYGDLRHYVNQANTIKDWKSFKNENRKNITTYWKDWSKVGLDLSQYAGQKVTLVLENFDCGVRDAADAKHIYLCFDRHESHMYAHVTCASKELVFKKDCEDEEDSISITAPEGFSYRWYDKKDKATTLSTERELRMKAADEDATYVCELTNHVGTFELEQVVDAAEVIVDDDVEVGFGKTFTWSRSGEKISYTGDYEYIENYSGSELQYYSKSCAKKIYRIHVEAAALDCPGTFTIKDTICGDARGINVGFHYTEKVDDTKEIPVTIYPSVKDIKVDFSDNWNNQDSTIVQIDDNTFIRKTGYKDITKAIAINGVAMDSVITIPMPYDSVYWEKTGEWIYSYPRPDDYTMTLTVMNKCGQEEKHTINFTVFYPSSVIYQRWNDVLSIQNELYNGGNPVATVHWYRNGQEIIGKGEHHSYIYSKDWNDNNLNTNDTFYAALVRKGETKSFCTCTFKPTTIDKANDPEFKGTLELAPRRSDNRQLEVVTTTSGQYTLYDVTGRALQNGFFGEEYGSPDIEIAPSVTRGTYLLFFRTNEGRQITKKWIVK